MIIVKLMGGLGNQMFQYAMGRRLSYHLNTDFFLDVKSYNLDTLRKFELNNFRIHATIAPQNLLQNIPQSKKHSIILKIKTSLSRTNEFKRFTERSFNFNKEIMSLPDNVYLEGYWQSEKYFIDIKNIIRSDFELKSPPEKTNQTIANKIRNCTSVGIHIRRGDYITNPVINAYHGTCSQEYFYKGIEFIEENIKNPYYFVFSDDIHWVKKHLEIPQPVYYINNNRLDKGYIDLWLLSQCKHQIISNSSFSWWAAWLNRNSKKIVIAPIRWFSGQKININDLIPESWVLL